MVYSGRKGYRIPCRQHCRRYQAVLYRPGCEHSEFTNHTCERDLRKIFAHGKATLKDNATTQKVNQNLSAGGDAELCPEYPAMEWQPDDLTNGRLLNASAVDGEPLW